MIRRCLRVAAAALLLAVSAAAERLPIRAYGVADGLAREQVHRIMRDSRGLLWISTRGGLCRFDGTTFKTHGLEQGIGPSVVTDIHETRSGELLVATAGGIRRLVIDARSPDRGRWIPLIATLSFPARLLAEAADGSLWAAGRDALFHLTKSGASWSVQRHDIPWVDAGGDGRDPNALIVDNDGSVWLGTDQGAFRLRGEAGLEPVRLSAGGQEQVTAFSLAPDGSLWVGLADALLRIRANRVLPAEDMNARAQFPRLNVSSILHASSGTTWVGTSTGLGELREGHRARVHDVADGLSDSVIIDLAEDAAGNAWIATESGGVMKLAREGFSTFAEVDGLAHSRIAQIFEDALGRTCAVDSTLTINVLEGRRFVPIVPQHLRRGSRGGWGWNQWVVPSRDGGYWIPSAQGVFRYAPVSRVEELAHVAPMAVYTRADGLPSDDIFRLYEDRDGDIWIAAFATDRPPLARWDRASGRIVPEPLEPVHPLAVVSAFAEDRDGHLWLGLADGGILRTNKGRDAQLIRFPAPGASTIRELHVDPKGRLWIAAERGGVGHIDDTSAATPVIEVIGIPQGLSSDEISCVLVDDLDRAWIGGGGGLDRLTIATGRIEHFGRSDGLGNSYVNVSRRAADGTLWFGTLRGLSRLTPIAPTRRPPPTVSIDEVISGDRIVPVQDLGEEKVSGVEVRPGDSRLEIVFHAISFVPGEVLRFQWRLDPDDEDWSAPLDQRRVVYQHLSPGNRVFRVRAVAATGRTSEPPAEVSFHVAPPFWRTWWFLGGLLAAGSLAVHAAYRSRVRRMVELERVRTRIATDLHDDIGAGLSQVAILSELAQRRAGDLQPDIRNSLERIAVVSRELVDSMSDIVWAVDPRRDAVRDLIHRMRRFASDVFEARGVEFTFEHFVGDEDLPLPADLRRQVYLVFKEAVNNAARHSNCSRAKVSLSRTASPAMLTLTVEDDGVGFELDGAITGVGLGSLVTRARAMGGTLDLSSVEGTGTIVTLTVPLKRST